MKTYYQTRILRLFIVALAVAVAGNLLAAGPSARKPSFIFILVDDMSWGDLGCFGHPYAKTPNLDRMAADGIRFTQFYVCAVECAPSRSALMTGRVPCKAGKKSNGQPRLDPGLPNVNNLLKPAGYATGHFGKWHLAKGFEAPADTEAREYGIDEWNLCSAMTHDALTAEKTTDAALGFIGRHQQTPFHMNVWYGRSRKLMKTCRKIEAVDAGCVEGAKGAL